MHRVAPQRAAGGAGKRLTEPHPFGVPLRNLHPTVRYRLLIFDFDGTLADSFPQFLDHMRQTVDHFGLRPIDAEALDELRGRSAAEVIKFLGIPAWKVPLVGRYVRRLMTADASGLRLFPGVSDALQRLAQQGLELAVVSSNTEANIRLVIGPETARLIGSFECGASLFGKAARFRKVLRQTGVPPAQALAIGDEIRDLEAAEKVQIDFGAVSWGYTKVAALRTFAPAFVFDHLAEIDAAVLGRTEPSSED